MKKWLEQYFGFNQKEIRGVYFLLLIIGILYVSPTIYSFLFPVTKRKISEKDKQEIRAFLASAQSSPTEDSSSSTSVEKKIDYFYFDPNELSVEDGRRLGLSMRQIQMIHNYTAKGGRFYKREDFQKIYAISKEDYERLSPYISILQQPPYQRNQSSYSKPKAGKQHSFYEKKIKDKTMDTLYIDLNSTDSVALQQLRGIGPVFASRIIRYRNRLGGFHNVSQLMDVYGMDEERYVPLHNQVFVDTTLIKKIDVNTADFKSLSKHPFIHYKEANAIIQYRKQHGKFEKAEDLLNILILDEVFLRKITPYLYFSK